MAVFHKHLPEFGTSVEIDCANVLRAVAYPSRFWGRESEKDVAEHVIQALCMEVLELRAKLNEESN